MTPPPDRIRLGDVWLDLQGRRHIARPCVVAGLVLMEPLDDVLVPVAMSAVSQTVRLLQGDCLEVMRTLADSSVDAVVTDPPYFNVKAEAWDRQWKQADDFLVWLGLVADEWVRILKPNGSLYCFASPQMAARVEVLISERMNVLNRIRWVKQAGWHQKAEKEALRSFLSPWEECIFAEHYGADNIAKGEAGYEVKCDELRGFLFEPLRAYLDGERERAGFDRKACDKACGNQMSGHYFSRVQWTLPTRENYEKLRVAFNSTGGEYLRREYEYLRREYEDLRRPFAVSAEVPYTDVWTFPTVQAYEGKHPCEKPLDMMRHIINTSTRPGALVLDPFMGSGSTGLACVMEGRAFIGIEQDPAYLAIAQQRVGRIQLELPLAAVA
jgi:site-specific DNA-methyltransferase (adenine-specific)